MESLPRANLSQGVARQKVEVGRQRRWGHAHQPGIESLVHLGEMRSNGTRVESIGAVTTTGRVQRRGACRLGGGDHHSGNKIAATAILTGTQFSFDSVLFCFR
ncbi:hypothetical protein D1007_57710 [Hordeum vulgare]|nr:hypothetical protein D1007_57710 [Hordeum vulgare]